MSAVVRIRLPSITTPAPVKSVAAFLVQGLYRSGSRTEENILTTDFSVAIGSAAWPPLASKPSAMAGDKDTTRLINERSKHMAAIIVKQASVGEKQKRGWGRKE